ncbi:MAG: peptide ABC transporter substrate-binding protein [Chlamydiales bacterium]|nr:peptide ABC transporter substrate-binding protein [Chlamydiales bacterium]
MKQIALCLLLLLTSCQPDATPKAPTKTLRVGANDGPQSLDPRTGRALSDATILNMLYEGLMRLSPEGGIAPGMAETYEVSDDLRTYTFHLRDTQWSDGTPVTAADFIHSWASQLDPNFAAPNIFALYTIKNARAIKAGSLPPEQLGAKAIDSKTLVVELEEPTPYFLDLTAFYALFPTNQDNPQVTNGPFLLDHYTPNSELVANKSPSYWNASEVKIDSVIIAIVDEHTALNMFESGALDWTGSPLSTIPPDAFATLAKADNLQVAPAAATHWLRFNVQRAPFNNVKLRRALAMAINRDELIQNVIQGRQVAAMSIVPSSPRWESQELFQDNDLEASRKLFAEALQELDLTVDQLPTITIMYGYSERHHKLAQALQQQWHQALGIWIDLEAMESKLFYDKLKRQDYFIANGSWFADFDDPINFLSVFESKVNGTNNTGWESGEFRELLRLSSLQADPAQRQDLLRKAERILIEDMPVAPIFFYSLNYLKRPKLEGVSVSPTGIQLFRDGYFGTNP